MWVVVDSGVRSSGSMLEQYHTGRWMYRWRRVRFASQGRKRPVTMHPRGRVNMNPFYY
nr:MAG TPA: hypothetical protein [Caudoviricetes sp.]